MEHQYIQETAWLEMDLFKIFFFLFKKIEKLSLVEQYQDQGWMYHSLLLEKTQNYSIYKKTWF